MESRACTWPGPEAHPARHTDAVALGSPHTGACAPAPGAGGHQGKRRRPLQLPRTYSPLPVADKASELAKALKEECNEACREKPSHVAQASHAEVLAPKDEVPLRAGRVQKVLLRPEACGRFLRG